MILAHKSRGSAESNPHPPYLGQSYFAFRYLVQSTTIICLLLQISYSLDETSTLLSFDLNIFHKHHNEDPNIPTSFHSRPFLLDSRLPNA